MITEFHLAARLYCMLTVTVTLSELSGTFEYNRAIVNVKMSAEKKPIVHAGSKLKQSPYHCYYNLFISCSDQSCLQ